MRDYQEWLEKEYSKKHIAKLVLEDILTIDGVQESLDKATEALKEWIYSPSNYDSKTKRKHALEDAWYIDDQWMIHKLVERIVCAVTQLKYTTLTNLVMQHLDIAKLEKREAILLSAEVISIVCIESELFSISKPYKQYMVESCLELSQEVEDHIAQTCYLPPMVSKPNFIKSNWDTPYYTYRGESLILGVKDNFHNGDISLDVINIQNQIPLRLDIDFIEVYNEPEPEYEIEDKAQLDMAKLQWERYLKQCSYFSTLLVGMGNKIYLGNKVDKRGRLYCAGYHISPQGNSYRKAVVELFKEELIECPIEYRN